MKKIVAALCALACVPAIAADKWIIGGSSTSFATAFDLSSIETEGDVNGTWVVDVYAKPANGFDYVVSWEQVNCKTKKTRSTDVSGRAFGKGTIKRFGNTDWERVEPGSVGEALLNRVRKKEQGLILGDFDTIEDAAEATREASVALEFWK